MVQNVSKSMFMDAFNRYGRKDQFSYNALSELYDYYESLGEDLGEEVELDVIAICCDWTEYDDEGLVQDYGYLEGRDDYDDEDDYFDAILNELNRRTFVIEVGKGCNWLVQNF